MPVEEKSKENAEQFRYISQEKITELLLKFEKRKGEVCTNVFIALQGQ